MKVCLNQLIRPQGPNIKIDGVGDCKICLPHGDNKNCKEYYPVTLTIEELKEKE